MSNITYFNILILNFYLLGRFSPLLVLSLMLIVDKAWIHKKHFAHTKRPEYDKYLL
jgi:hypothetical protein